MHALDAGSCAYDVFSQSSQRLLPVRWNQKKDGAVKINVDALVMVDTMRFAE